MVTAEEQTPDRLLFSMSVPPDPSCVGVVRRRLAESLRRTDRPALADLADDACLVVSELVTNALLHAGSQIAVTASYDDRSLLVQVTDDSPHVPRPRRYGDQARTGRGLHLVESMCDEWGVVRLAAGKTVWVRWSTSDEAAPAHGGGGDHPPGEPAREAETVTVTFLHFPLLLHAAWREHVQALLRDYLLASLGADDDADDAGAEVAAVVAHAEVTDAISVLDEHLSPWDLSPSTVLAAAVEPEVTVERVLVPVPVSSVSHFDTLDHTSNAALVLAGEGRLLTPPTLPEVRAFRQWVCAQVREQAAGRPPTPFSVGTVDRHDRPPPAAVADRGWDETAVAGADTGVIAADSRSVIVAVSRPAAHLLGYDDPAELVGRRLVSVIPARLRQAHVAGMTMYLLTDRRPLLEGTVTVPALARDGRELLVDLEIREQPTTGERPLLVARIAAHPVGG